MPPVRSKSAFTLVELLAVIAIIALLMGLLLPAVQGAREAARRVQCGNNIRQIALAIQDYAVAMNALPKGVANKNVNANPGCNASYLGGTPDTWATEIMPRMDLLNLHDALNFSRSVQDPANEPLVLTPLPGLVCPSDPRASQPVLGNRCTINRNSINGRAHGQWYCGSIGPMAPRYQRCPLCPVQQQGPSNPCCLGDSGCSLGSGGTPAAGFFSNHPTRVSFDSCTDGLSNTILVGETLPAEAYHNGLYMSGFMTVLSSIPVNTFALPGEIDPNGTPCTSARFAADYRMNGIKSRHPGGAQVAMGDGSVRLLGETIAFELLWALGTRRAADIDVLPAIVP